MSFVLNISSFAFADSQITSVPFTAQYTHLPTVHIEVIASTWKTRGRLLYDIEGSVRVKLAAAGFPVVREKSEPHDVVYFVNYQELRGEPYGINQFSTILTGNFRLENPQQGILHELQIEETSHPTISGPPPYLDALRNFQTNPFYFYLGDILRGHLLDQHDPHMVLIETLQHFGISDFHKELQYLPDDAIKDQAHYMTGNEELYEPVVVRQAVETLTARKEARIIPALYKLVYYPDMNVRVESVKAFSAFDVKKAIPLIRKLSIEDPSRKVRAAALHALDSLQG